MANNYESFAADFPFPEKAARELMDFLEGMVDKNDDIIPGYILDALDYPGWLKNHADAGQEGNAFEQFCYDNDIWLSDVNAAYEDENLYLAGENANMDLLTQVLSLVMKEHEIRDVITLQAGYWCDKLRPGEFGGIAWAVGPGIVEGMGTHMMAESLAEKVRNQILMSPEPKA